MTDECVFGPSEKRPDGVYPQPAAVLPPQITDWMVESCAIHSASRGWLPGVVIRIATDDGAGMVCSVVVGDALTEIVQNLRVAAQAARRDVATALARGDLR